MKFHINIFDNDYRSFAYSEEKEFKTYEEAEEYCKEQSWTGESYQIERMSLPKNHPKYIAPFDNGYW